MAKIVGQWMELVVRMKKEIVVGFVGLLFAANCAALTPTPTMPIPIRFISSAFTAVNSQGRPMAGANISVTDTMGNPVIACIDAACTSGQTQVSGTGVFQFYAATGQYNVSLSLGGEARSYRVNIPPSGLSDAILGSDFPNANAPGIMEKLGDGVYGLTKVNFIATTDPGVNNDDTEGYSIGSQWINLNSDTVWFLTDASTGAAVWVTAQSGVTSVNGKTGAITLQFGSSGNDVNITNPSGSILQLNIPSADDTKRGLVTTGSQDFAGFKTFFDGVTINNNQGGSGVFDVLTENWHAIRTDPASDAVDFFADLGSYNGWVNIAARSGSLPALTVTHEASGNAITGRAGSGAAYVLDGSTTTGNTGGVIKALAGATGSRAGLFSRSVSGSTVPVVEINRTQTSDAQALLVLKDLAASTTATAIASYSLNGTVKWALDSNGQIVGTPDISNPTFTSFLDMDTGFGFTGGDPAMVDEGLPILTVHAASLLATSAGGFLADKGAAIIGLEVLDFGTGDILKCGTKAEITATGEVNFAGISGDGSQKIVCIKSDGNLGTCSGSYSSGTCTCA